jgi:hypothetical protein
MTFADGGTGGLEEWNRSAMDKDAEDDKKVVDW